MAKRLIGYAVTNSSGVATLNYIGQGLGELSITAETGGEMLFSDIGTSGTGYTNFYNYATFNPSVDSTGTLLTYNTSSTANYYVNIGTTDDLYDFEPPFVVEYDVVSYSATYTGIQITESGASGVIKNYSQLTNKASFHLKVTVTGEKIIYQVDNDTPIEQTYSTSKVRVSLTLNNGTLKYKNFFMYTGSTQLTSDSITLLDCQFYDNATNTNHRTTVTSSSSVGSWLNVSGALNVSYSSDGTTVTNVDSTATNRHFFYHDTIITSTKVGNYNSILNNCNIEFNITAITGTIDFYVTDGTNSRGFGLTATGHYKFVCDGSKINVYKDNSETPLYSNITMNGTNLRLSFLLNATNESITFKEFKVYPI